MSVKKTLERLRRAHKEDLQTLTVEVVAWDVATCRVMTSSETKWLHYKKEEEAGLVFGAVEPFL